MFFIPQLVMFLCVYVSVDIGYETRKETVRGEEMLRRGGQ